MLTRLYANNFRCLVAFETGFDSFGVLCGPNGAGKSSVFDAARLIRNLATGDGYLGGSTDKDVPFLEFTNWHEGTTLASTTQEFELGIKENGLLFEYLIHIEQKATFEKPRIIKESAQCDGKILFQRNLEGVTLMKQDGSSTSFPLDWRQAALASIQPRGKANAVELLQTAFSKLLILRPNPRGMEKESKGESNRPDLYYSNLISWYRFLAQEQDWTDALRDSLQDVWPDFKSFKLVDVGLNAKALQLRFEPASGQPGFLFFDQLSDGEKALIGLYMARAALKTGAVQTVLVDEPDNFVGLPELQPWVLSMRELLDDRHQCIIISHHPELLNNTGDSFGRYLWRDNHTSPSRIGPLKVPSGISPSEAVARGWVNG